MLTGAAMAAVPQAAATRAVSGSQPGAGFRSAVSGGRAALLRPTVARRPVRAAPVLTRAGEALDWENDDFVPASKANKKKKNKGGNAAQQAKQTKKMKAAPVAESLEWENDDFVPAGKAKKNKKKPKAGGAQAAADVEPPPIVADVPDWENDDFVPAGKAKKNKKKAKQAPEPEPEPEPVAADETFAAADAAQDAADAAAEAAAAQAAAAAAAAEAAAAAAAAAEAKAKAAAEAAAAKAAQAAAEAEAAAAAASSEPEPEPVAAMDEDADIEEIDDAALEKATKKAIREAEEQREREEEARLAAIDWNAPDEETDDANPIPAHLRDIFEKDAKPSKRRTSGTVTNGVRLEGVKKSFKGMEVLKGASWDCKRGEKVGLVGWNGAGKTTQLRIITGEMEADEGEVMLADKVKIGYLTQEFEVKETNTVREEFMSSFGEESKVLADTERIQKALEDEPSMELMTILLEKLDELQRKAERLDLFNMERAIDKIMPSLGFVPEDNDRLVASFSGGWQMRISLGKILLQEPGLLLMDEPTNHLDLDAIQWLEEYLKSVDVPMVIVSHDREFLDQLCTKTVEVERGRATTYKGNYSDYQRQKASGSAQQMVAYEKYMKEVTRQKEMIRRLSGGGQSGRANAAAKELERLEEDPVEKPWTEKERRFRFPDAPRSSAIVARVENLTHGYDEKTLFKNTNLQIDRGERVAMIGANGCGKSTLMRLMQGREKPLGGIAELGSDDLCMVNYFYQNQAEGLDTNKGVLQTLVEAAPDEGLNDLKALLGRMKFSTSFHNKPVKFLSGGEKARLALAKFMVTPANVLLLDEPTNHLDIPSKEMLEEAIKSFDGTVIAISHDRYFLRQIATRVLNFDEGRISDYAGDYAYFLEKNDKAGARDERLQNQAKEVEKSQIKAKSKMSKAEKAKMKKEKAKAFGGGSGKAKKNKNAGRWN
jgi:ATPase subunit of ABC transporter with duplicated ATPase domains